MTDNAILVTGAAGFIGFHVAHRLLSAGRDVVGLDIVNDYYDPRLKEARLDILKRQSNFTFVKLDLANRNSMKSLFAQYRFPVVIHLAAQAGVRYSLQNPHAYTDANIEGFINVLEGCRHGDCRHLLFASSSSVYGANTKLPFSVQDNVDHPISLYAASKKANELMAHAYSHLYRIPATGLRFFTVYGPWGRPDMAMFIFARAILSGTPIRLFNQRQHAAGFHLCRRRCRGRRAADGSSAAREPSLVGRQTRSSHQCSPLEDLQHRQQPSRRTPSCGLVAREGIRPHRYQGNAADAAR